MTPYLTRYTARKTFGLSAEEFQRIADRVNIKTIENEGQTLYSEASLAQWHDRWKPACPPCGERSAEWVNSTSLDSMPAYIQGTMKCRSCGHEFQHGFWDD